MDLAPRPLMWNLGVSVPPLAPVSWLPQGHEWRFASAVRTSGRYAWSGTLTAHTWRCSWEPDHGF